MKHILVKSFFVFGLIVLVTSLASAMVCTNLTKALSKGSENNEVLKLQQFLFDGGYLTVKPNGYFGNGTVAAVKKFQASNKLSQVGSVGVVTRGKIKDVSCKSINNVSTRPANVSSTIIDSKLKAQIVNSTDTSEFVSVPIDSSCTSYSCLVKKLENCTPFAVKQRYKNDIALINKSAGISGKQDNKCKVFLTGEYSSDIFIKRATLTSSCLVDKDESKIFEELILESSNYVKGYIEGSITLDKVNQIFSRIKTTPESVSHNCVYQFEPSKVTVSDFGEEGIRSRNFKRQKDVNTLAMAVGQYMDSNNGKLPSSVNTIQKEICISSNYSCEGMVELLLSPNYLPIMLVEPGSTKKNGSGYMISREGGIITISSQFAEGGVVIKKSF